MILSYLLLWRRGNRQKEMNGQGFSTWDVCTSEETVSSKVFQVTSLLWFFWGNGSGAPINISRISQSCGWRQRYVRRCSFKILTWQAIVNLPPGGFPRKDKIVTWSDFPEAQMLHRVVSRHMSISFNHVSYDKISAFLTIPQLLLNMHWPISLLACGIHKASIVLQSKSNQHREKRVTSCFLDTVLLLIQSKITSTFKRST